LASVYVSREQTLELHNVLVRKHAAQIKRAGAKTSLATNFLAPVRALFCTSHTLGDRACT